MLQLVTPETGTPVFADLVVDMQVAGSGAPLLLLHGAEGVKEDSQFIENLAQRYTVYAPTHPGFGTSPRPSWFDSVDDLAYLYLEWLRREGLDDVSVVGLQFGGWVAAEIAVRSTDRIRNLVLVDTVGFKFGAPTDREITDIFAIGREDLDARRYAIAQHRFGDPKAAGEEDLLHLARNEEALALYGWEPYLHNPRLVNWLGRIDVPTLVLWGEEDGIVSPTYGEAVVERLSRGTFKAIQRAGHCAQVDQPRVAAEAIFAFNDTQDR